MVLWRISNHISLSGLGAEISGGRWHTPSEGRRIAYLSEHPAVSLIENLVNLRRDATLYPVTYQLLKIVVSDSVSAADLTPEQLSDIDPRDTASTQAIGDGWLAAKASALLRVPSIPSPESWDYLFNPLHPEAASLSIEWAKKIAYDRRLFRLSE